MTLRTITILSSAVQDQGRWKEAEELQVQVMETSKRVLGEEHPSTLTTIANLGQRTDTPSSTSFDSAVAELADGECDSLTSLDSKDVEEGLTCLAHTTVDETVHWSDVVKNSTGCLDEVDQVALDEEARGRKRWRNNNRMWPG